METPLNKQGRDELAERLARQMKIAMLRAMPGMDRVAVALNAAPNADEIYGMARLLDMVDALGYAITKKAD